MICAIMQPRSWLTVLKVLFLTVVALVLADFVSLTIREKQGPPPITTPIAPPPAAVSGPVVSEEQIVESTLPLLGDHPDITKETPKPVAAASSQPAVSAAPVPDPSLQMSLVGTIVSPGASIAILTLGGKEAVVHENDSIGNPAFIVEEIGENSIKLAMNGQTKTLWMPSFQPANVAASGPPAAAGMLPPPPPPTLTAPSGAPLTPGKAVVSKQERDKMMSNLPETLKKLRILPNKKDGADYGSQVVYLEPGSFLSKAGLAQGDILLSVNGKPVNNASDGLAVFQAFQYEDKLVMKIDRGGHVVEQEVEFR
jgi:type II secretion system protein C